MAHVVPGPAGPPPLGPDGFDWTAWHADPVVVGGLVVLGAAYAAATLWRNRLAPGARVEPAKALCFAGALGVLFVALTGPLHDLSDYYLFSAHMVQHMLLVFALPPLLLHGTPGWMVRPMLRDPRLLQLGRVLTRPAAAFAVFNVILVAWHLPPVYNLAMDQHQVHIVGHLLMIAGSVILWWPVLSPVRELPRAPYPVQLLYLFVVGLPMVMVAIFISMADGLLYPYYAASPRIWAQLTPRADQHLGGLIMWIPGGLVFLIAISVIFFRWQGAGGDDVAVRGEAEGEPSEYKRALPSAVEAEPTAGRGEAEGEPTEYKRALPSALEAQLTAGRGEAEGEPTEYKRALPSAVEAEPTAGRGAAEGEPTAYKKGVPG